MKVGFIGLGRMGQAIAQRILDGGYELVVYNRTRSKADDLEKAGARVADSIAEATTGQDVVITMLTDDAALRDVLDGLAPDFAALSGRDRHERVAAFSQARPAEFAGLLARVYDCYYQDDRVRERIGVVKGAVFPQGNEVVQGDLSLLDPVIANSERHGYRRP